MVFCVAVLVGVVHVECLGQVIVLCDCMALDIPDSITVPQPLHKMRISSIVIDTHRPPSARLTLSNIYCSLAVLFAAKNILVDECRRIFFFANALVFRCCVAFCYDHMQDSSVWPCECCTL